MEDWISPKVIQPPQAKKILCFIKGDVWVGYRFGDLWVQLPYCMGKAIETPAPLLWKDIGFPGDFTGFMLFQNLASKKRDLMIFDEFEKEYPEDAQSFIDEMKRNLLDTSNLNDDSALASYST